jgi:thiol:disulfide interchange protein DsbC
MNLKALLAAAAAAALVAVPALAQVSPESIKAEIKKKVPEAQVESVRKMPYGNLYEVVAGGDIFYTDDKTSFIMVGPIIDLKSRENVTDARMRQLNAVKFDTLPFDSAIKIVRGNGSRKIAIFEDPNCGYCKRFERDLQSVSDITVYVFLYPILAPDSVTKAKAIWCSPNPGKAWIDTMVRDTVPTKEGTCPTPLDKNLALGREKRIHGTPTIIFENGERVPGAITMADLEKKFAEAKTPIPTASAK